MIHYSACPQCKNNEISFALRCVDHLVTGEVFEVFRCPACGFLFTQDHPDESESGKYYESEEYISHTNAHQTFFDKLYQLGRKIMLRRKKKDNYRKCILLKGSILDIGSGTGHFLYSMKMAGWKTDGIEINIKARDYSRSLFNLDIHLPGEMESIPDNSYDCITLWHVLEHFHQPVNYFREIKRIIKPGGKVIVALPNSDSYDAGYYGSDWAAYDVPRHLWHFNPQVFSRFANDNGFEISSVSYLPLDVFYISILSEKCRGNRMQFVSGFLRGFYFSLLSLFRKLKSSSIVYILKESGN